MAFGVGGLRVPLVEAFRLGKTILSACSMGNIYRIFPEFHRFEIFTKISFMDYDLDVH